MRGGRPAAPAPSPGAGVSCVPARIVRPHDLSSCLMGQLYELRIVATGEVRDADGNLVEQRPVEASAVLTEDQAAALVVSQQEDPSWP